ncbi:hypothetical protein AB3S75_021980 [Citrus x aurantiifolia]
MQEKNNSHFNALGICQRLFNFFRNSLIARGLKHVTLGQSPPQGYDSSIPAKSNGELMVHRKDHETSKQNSGSEIQVLFKQSEELESWTPVDPIAPKISVQAGNKIGSEQRPSARKKEIPLLPLEKTEQRLRGKRSDHVVPEPNITVGPTPRSGPKKTVSVKGSDEEEDRRKMKGKSIAIDKFKKRPPLSVAPNINEKSDEFIRSKKEAMNRTMGMEPKKKDQIFIRESVI